MPGRPVNRQHNPGTYSGYNWHMERRKELGKDGRIKGKRHRICAACRAANTAQMERYRKRSYLSGGSLRRPACGARRRLQALATLGWSYKEIGRKYGKDASFLGNLSNMRNKESVYLETIEKLSAIYDELSMIEAPENCYTKRNKTAARMNGYVGPLAWEDEAIDNPYAIPQGLTHRQAYEWYWHAASDIERIEYVLEHGLQAVRAFPYKPH